MRAVQTEVDGERVTLLLRYRELRALEKVHGIDPEDLPTRVRRLEDQRAILKAALEGGSNRPFEDTEVDALLDRIPQLRLRFLLMRTVLEAYGKKEPGDGDIDPPKGEATASPPTGGSGGSPSPSASA